MGTNLKKPKLLDTCVLLLLLLSMIHISLSEDTQAPATAAPPNPPSTDPSGNLTKDTPAPTTANITNGEATTAAPLNPPSTDPSAKLTSSNNPQVATTIAPKTTASPGSNTTTSDNGAVTTKSPNDTTLAPVVTKSTTLAPTPTGLNKSISTENTPVSGQTTSNPAGHTNATSNQPKPSTSATTNNNVNVTTQAPAVTSTVKQTTGNSNTVNSTTEGTATPAAPTNATHTTESTTKGTSATVAPTNETATTAAPTKGTSATVAATNETATTAAPTKTTAAPSGSTTLVVTTNKTTEENTSSPPATTTPVNKSTSSSKPSSSAPTTIPSTLSPSGQLVYINEIIVDKQGIFQKIEIQISDTVDISHYAIVMVDGRTSKTLSVMYLRNFTQTDTGFFYVSLKSISTMPTEGVGIAVYDTKIEQFTDDWIVTDKGVVDALVIGKTYEGVSNNLVKILTPGVDPFVLDPSKYGIERSISRCSINSVRSTEMFALIKPSMGKDNAEECTYLKHFQNTFSMKISMDCGQLKNTDNSINKHLLHEVIKSVVKDVNRRCQCGITRMHIVDPEIKCCEWTNLDMKFVAPNKTQDDEFISSFRTFIKETATFKVDGKTYDLDQNCRNNCCASSSKPLSKKDDEKNVKVTVAVIVTLLVLFLIIVLVVYMYMRRKKIAVQQFRMSRLEEEDEYDDMNVNMTGDDHDEFVGGQEATFDLKA